MELIDLATEPSKSWIYAYVPEIKPQSTVWVFENPPSPKEVVRGRSISKQMVDCFFCKTGRVATVPLEHHGTVNSEWFA